MRGTIPRRAQGMADPVLALMVHAMGLETAPHYSAATPKIKDYRRQAEIMISSSLEIRVLQPRGAMGYE